MNFYKHHLGDYASKTQHLSWDEDCAYRRLLDQYYKREAAIPADIKEACRLARATTSAQKRAVEAVLREFFTLTDTGWHQGRCDEEIEAADTQAKTNRRIAEQREAAKRARREHEACNESCNEPSHDSCHVRQPIQTPDSRLQTPEEDSVLRTGEPDSPSVDQALFADARKVFGRSIGGQVNPAIKTQGKPWFLGVLESCRSKDPEAARAYLAAALNGAKKPDEAEQRRTSIA